MRTVLPVPHRCAIILLMTHSASPTAPTLPPLLPIQPIARPIDLDMAVPGSKSITNRHLVMSALSDGEVTLTGVLHSDDTVHMIQGLRTLGLSIEDHSADNTC